MKILKRIVAIFLVVMLCGQSFAAVVSDNDGSAFITKAEFDSLKNNFQAQIDSYNSSIDNKIDGAIASYLSGIQLASDFPQTLVFPTATFLATPTFYHLNDNRRFIYYNPFQVNEAAKWGNFHWESVSKPGLVTENDIYNNRVYLEVSGFSWKNPTTKAKLEEFNLEMANAVGASSALEFYQMGNTTTYGKFVDYFGFNVICYETIDGMPVLQGMGIMDSTFGQTQDFMWENFSLVEIQGKLAGYSNPRYKLNDGSFVLAAGAGLENLRKGVTDQDNSLLSNYYYLLENDSELKLDFQVDAKNGTWYFNALLDPMLWDSDGGYSASEISKIHPGGGTGTLKWNKIAKAAGYEYMLLGTRGSYYLGNASAPASQGVAGSTLKWEYFEYYPQGQSWYNLKVRPVSICNDVATPILSNNWRGIKLNTGASTFYAMPASSADYSWLDEKWPCWSQGFGPQFSILENVNDEGQYGGEIKYRDKMFKEGDPWYQYRPEVAPTPKVSMADGTLIGYLPLFKISPADEDLISVKDIYCAQYATEAKREFGKSIVDGPCICKCTNDGNLTFEYTNTKDNCKIYFSKEPFQSARDTGNVAYSVDGVSYGPGEGFTSPRTVRHKVRINDVMAGDRFYIKTDTGANVVKLFDALISVNN